MNNIVKDLEKLLTGPLYSRHTPEYQDATTLFNTGVQHCPLLVVRPQDNTDLAALLKYCSCHDLTVTVRNGGHSSNGYSLNSGGIVVDMRSMANITSNQNTVNVGAGANWDEVYYHVSAQSPADYVIGATWPSVGVTGFVLGGGYSFVSRSHGLSCDNIVSCKIVTAEGYEMTVGEDSKDPLECELFWGLKGGGGGNFGIVSEVKLKRYTATEKLLTGVFTFVFERFDEVITFYDSWASSLPNSISIYGAILAQPDPSDPQDVRLVVRLSFATIGSHTAFFETLAPLFAMKPDETNIYFMRLPEWARHLSGSDAGGFGAYTRSAMLPAGSLAKATTSIKAFVNRTPKEAIFIVWTHAGGIISDIDAATASFANRTAEYVLAIRVFWPIDRPDVMRPLITSAYHMFEQIAPLSLGAYLNYIDPLLTGWREKYYGSSYSRLVMLKNQLDPAGTLLFQQGIGSSFEPELNSDGTLNLEPIFRTRSDHV